MFSAQTNNAAHSIMCSYVSFFLSSFFSTRCRLMLFNSMFTIILLPIYYYYSALISKLDVIGQIRLTAPNRQLLVSMDRLIRFNFG